MKKAGRPPTPGENRDKLVSFYLTKTDWDILSKVAKEGGFRGTSTLLVSLVEPILQGGFSIQSACRSVNRIQKFMEGNGVKFGMRWDDLFSFGRDLFSPSSPPPPIPDDIEDLSRLKADLRALLAELENQTEPTK